MYMCFMKISIHFGFLLLCPLIQPLFGALINFNLHRIEAYNFDLIMLGVISH